VKKRREETAREKARHEELMVCLVQSAKHVFFLVELVMGVKLYRFYWYREMISIFLLSAGNASQSVWSSRSRHILYHNEKDAERKNGIL